MAATARFSPSTAHKTRLTSRSRRRRPPLLGPSIEEGACFNSAKPASLGRPTRHGACTSQGSKGGNHGSFQGHDNAHEDLGGPRGHRFLGSLAGSASHGGKSGAG